ncbi:MAG: hypothetical protein V7L11_17075 [Nostoc sp.]|uniref:hypothetical protein n=1 Tax=Nostoc sp. TaxID=1180 RepID=UPI002FF7929B
MQHILISLVLAYGIDGQDFNIVPEKQAGFVIHLELVFTYVLNQFQMQSSTPAIHPTL